MVKTKTEQQQQKNLWVIVQELADADKETPDSLDTNTDKHWYSSYFRMTIRRQTLKPKFLAHSVVISSHFLLSAVNFFQL